MGVVKDEGCIYTVADLGERDGGPGFPPPRTHLILVKKNHRRKKSRQGKQKKTAPSPLAQGLDIALPPP